MSVLVTTGPTREYLDPVRFLSNPSSGKMGIAIAGEALRLGAKVTLISGPTSLTQTVSKKIKLIQVITAEGMYRAVMKKFPRADLIFMVAAVSDWRPANFSSKKLKIKKRWPLPLVPTPDILATVGRKKKKGQLLIGFAAETNNLVLNARAKMKKKNCDLMIANKVGSKNVGFESDHSRGYLLSKDSVVPFPLLSKQKLARKILKVFSKPFSN
ncbi:MAG: phosphopantothenoylcysteine decarboxylase [Deltaproteobacteria bacterium]|nr:phosphopantothenoylcysteine decarboxylase [Deltaproteobacteria bacterium]